MIQRRKTSGFWVILMVAILFPAVALSGETRQWLVAKPPKLNGGVTTDATSPAATPAATPVATSAASPDTIAVPVQAAPTTPAAKSNAPGASVSRPSAATAEAAAAAPVESTAAPSGPDPTLVALGALGASNLYFSYLTLGTVADGYVSGTYEPQVAISVANEAIFMNTTAKTNLEKLLESANLAKEDKDVVSYMVATYDILINQAKSLVQFISNQKDDGTSYQKYRTEAWKRIVELFGIK